MDPDTWRAVSGSVHESWQNGLDAAEQLWSRDLVLDASVVARIRHQAVSDVLTLLEDWKPAEILRRRVRDGTPGNPTDMYLAMVQFLEEYRDTQKE